MFKNIPEGMELKKLVFRFLRGLLSVGGYFFATAARVNWHGCPLKYFTRTRSKMLPSSEMDEKSVMQERSLRSSGDPKMSKAVRPSCWSSSSVIS